jgi:hypothetical protein
VAEAEILTQILGVAALIISSIALFFTARSYSRGKINEQVKMAHEIMNSLKEHMDKFNLFRAHYPKDPEGNLLNDQESVDIDEHDRLIMSVFGDLNRLSYLMDNGVITDPKVTNYFDTAILEFYEENFLPIMDRFKRKYGGRPFSDFENRYQKIKEKWKNKRTGINST